MAKKTGKLKSLGSKKTKYNLDKPNPDVLESFDNEHSDWHLITLSQARDEFTSLCPKTGQPDHARIEIIYVPDKKCVESKSLKLYLFSYRNEGSFHEDVCNKIANDLCDLLRPYYLRVYGDFAQRGGIAIKPLIERWLLPGKQYETENVQWLVKSYDLKKKNYEN